MECEDVEIGGCQLLEMQENFTSEDIIYKNLELGQIRRLEFCNIRKMNLTKI